MALPAPTTLPTTSVPVLQPITEADLNQALVPVQQEVQKEHEISFDILDLMNDADNDEILMAATQKENQYKSKVSTTTKTMTLIKNL